MNNKIFDVIGIGFGSAGIALAAVMEDNVEAQGSHGLGNVLFLEQAPKAAWQPGMLLRETDIQHHYFRDFATPRNPRSRFTFANYIKEKGRIFDFGELVFGVSGGAVSRIEWNDYVTWVANQLSSYVQYSTEVYKIIPILENNEVRKLQVETNRGTYTTRTLIVCQGRKANIPTLFQEYLSLQVFHSVNFLPAIKQLDKSKRFEIAVIGSGQSAAEILVHLHSEFPNAKMHVIQRSIGFQQIDLCQFSNELFHDKEVDEFYNLSSQKRRELVQEARRANYSAIDQEIANTLYRKYYEDMVEGEERFIFYKKSNITSVKKIGDKYICSIENKYSGQLCEVISDVVILCTGFSEEIFPQILEPLSQFFVQEDIEEKRMPIITREYRCVTTPNCHSLIYFSGITERTHGLSDSTSFSMMALKAERIYQSLKLDRQLLESPYINEVNQVVS
jgi:L-ornithine N5-oxygenase